MTELIKMIFRAVTFSITQLKCTHPAYDGLIRYDFEMGQPRENLMILCFSHLKDWLLVSFLLILVVLSPFSLFGLQKILLGFGDVGVSILAFLYDGRVEKMLLFFVIGFVFQWILRLEFIATFFTALFLAQGDLHINLAVSFIAALFVSRACLMWWMRIELVSRTRKVWSWWSSLQLICTFMWFLGCLATLDQLHALGFFKTQMQVNRIEFVFWMVSALVVINLAVASVWGHFYNLVKPDPSQVKIRFSSVTWLLRIKMGPKTRALLLEVIDKRKITLGVAREQFQELKDQGPVKAMKNLGQVIETESSYLQLATSRLTREG